MREATDSKPPPAQGASIADGGDLATNLRREAAITTGETDSVCRLIEIAKRDSGQSRWVADFLLAWWNADACRAFALTNLWVVDDAIAVHILAVCVLIARVRRYPDSLSSEDDFKEIRFIRIAEPP